MTVRRAAAVVVAVLTLIASGVDRAQAHPRGPLYRYVSLDTGLPSGVEFVDPAAITDRSAYVNGYRCDETACTTSVLERRDRSYRFVHAGTVVTANDLGVVGGSVDLDPAAGTFQAALFARGRVRVIPQPAGVVDSQVIKVTETGIALVVGYDTDFAASYYLALPWGRIVSLDLGPRILFVTVNDWGIVAATRYGTVFGTDRAIRYDPWRHRTTVLEPVAPGEETWAQGIDDSGDVLGYSFVVSHLERIGRWGRDGTFHTSFVEGTPEVPTVSNALRQNRRGLIVVTRTTDGHSYLVPRPGVRVVLSAVTDHLDPWTLIYGVNDRGDLIGVGGSRPFDVEHSFVLRRVR